MEYTRRWPEPKLVDIKEWASPEIRTIEIMSDVSPVPFTLTVRRFDPLPDDCVHRAWLGEDNVKRHLETTPYAIVSMRSALSTMRRYITESAKAATDYLLRDTDELIKITYDHAYLHLRVVEDAAEKKLIGDCLRLWVAISRTATLEHIIGEDKLDMVPSDDPTCPLAGKICLPPVMIQQLDMILSVGILAALRKSVLEEFQKLLQSYHPRSFITVYLIVFMSLHSCAMLSAENYRNARRQGLRRRFSFPSFISKRHEAANIFLAYYHYVLEMANPFKQNWSRRHSTPFASLSTDDILFLEKTKALVADRAETFKAMKEQDLYENRLYFISQLYEEKWTPRNSIIDFDDGTTYGGPIKRYYGQRASNA